jgi:hypothetical protein
LGDRMENLDSYSWKFTTNSSHSHTTRQSTEAELGKELRQMKELVQ